MPDISAIVFDLDDTLYPEKSFVYSGYAAVAEAFRDRLGDPDATLIELMDIYDSPDRSRAFDALLDRRGFPEDRAWVAGVVEVYRAHAPAIALYADADAALARLRRSFRFGIITDGPARMQNAKIEALGVRSRVNHVILTDELGEGFAKPHPHAFEAMAAALGVPHANCAYVADNAAKDFVAPNALGWTTIRLIREEGVYRNAPPAPGGTPQFTIDALSTLDDIVCREHRPTTQKGRPPATAP